MMIKLGMLAALAGKTARHATAIQAPMHGTLNQALACVCLNQPSFCLATEPTCSTACR